MAFPAACFCERPGESCLTFLILLETRFLAALPYPIPSGTWLSPRVVADHDHRATVISRELLLSRHELG